MEPHQNHKNESEDENEDDDDTLIFRKVSIERLSAPEQLNKLFIPIRSHLWLVWATLGFLATALMLWLSFGSIPVFIEGVGIVMNRKGLFTIQSKTAGVVKEILVNSGDLVQQDQLVARIYDSQEELRYQSANQRVRKLEEDLKTLENQIQIEVTAQKEAIKKQIAAEEFTISELVKIIPELTEAEKTQKKLLQDGLISSKAYQETKQNLSQRLIALETARGTLSALKANLSKSYREPEVQEKKRALLNAKQQQDLLKLSLRYDTILSPAEGRVLEILVDKGYHVQIGTPLLHMEYGIKGEAQHIVYAFVPVEMGKRIEIGTEVKIELTTIKVEEFGAIVGKVIEVSHYAISKENLASRIQNEGLVSFLTKGADAVVQVTVEPVLDPTTPTGYKWTSGEGPPGKITTGTICIVRGIVDRVRPFYYFFHLGV
jgi:HlyD family secretion protein